MTVDPVIVELVRESRSAQGLPPTIEDRDTLERAARLVASARHVEATAEVPAA